jgi:hypothetical protein
MSDRPSERPPAPRSGRNPFVTGLLIFIGIILLLPGLCSVAMIVVLSGDRSFSAGTWPFLLITFAISAGGIALIVFAIRRP